MITGKTLIAWGYEPGPWFAAAIAAAEEARCAGDDEPAIRAIVERFAPAPPSVGLRDPGAVVRRAPVKPCAPASAGPAPEAWLLVLLAPPVPSSTLSPYSSQNDAERPSPRSSTPRNTSRGTGDAS